MNINNVPIEFKTKDGTEVSFMLELDDNDACATFVEQCIAAEVGRRVGVRIRADVTTADALTGQVNYAEFAERRTIKGFKQISRQAELNTYISAVGNLQASEQFANIPLDAIMTILNVPADMQDVVRTNIMG